MNEHLCYSGESCEAGSSGESRECKLKNLAPSGMPSSHPSCVSGRLRGLVPALLHSEPVLRLRLSLARTDKIQQAVWSLFASPAGRWVSKGRT